jgi:RNA polymerase sigma factor (sigma-70 family)
MTVAAIPPFERFYEAHNGEVLAFLRRRAGRERADDLFQETFLRALRAYAKLEHGEHLRAWVMTIAANTLVDAARRERPTTELPPDELTAEPGGEDRRPAFEELAPLTDALPPKERAAVVLRYGYALDYDEIGAALGSSEDAARQAASAGVRRLRKEKSQ